MTPINLISSLQLLLFASTCKNTKKYHTYPRRQSLLGATRRQNCTENDSHQLTKTELFNKSIASHLATLPCPTITIRSKISRLIVMILSYHGQ